MSRHRVLHFPIFHFEYDDLGATGYGYYYKDKIMGCEGDCTICSGEIREKCKYMLECSRCSNDLSLGYVYIVETLREHNLLPKDFKKLCCHCFYEVNKNENK